MALPTTLFDFDSEDEFVDNPPPPPFADLTSKRNVNVKKQSTKKRPQGIQECKCAKDDRHWTDFPGLIDVVPSNHEYKVCEWEQHPHGFIATLRLEISTPEDMIRWKKDLEHKTLITYRKDQTRDGCTGQKVLYKGDFICQHSKKYKSLPKGRSKKNTECDSSLKVVVKNSGIKNSSSKDHHLKDLPSMIKIKWIHNHTVNTAAALKLRDVSDHTKAELIELFGKGHNPGSALDALKAKIHKEQNKDSDGYLYAGGDRSLVPDYYSVWRLHRSILVDKYGDSKSDGYRERLDSHVQDLRERGHLVNYKYTSDDQFVFAALTPIMRRNITRLQQASELSFVDSTGSCDADFARVFLLLSHCSAGGVPIGTIITSSESTETLKSAFDLLKSLLPKTSFGHRGYPDVWMTDDCDALRAALYHSFPGSKRYLCVFHILQAIWRWLMDGKHGILQSHRQDLYRKAKALIYASDEGHLLEVFNDLEEQCSYANYIDYIQIKIMQRPTEVVLCYRSSSLIRGNQTNNYCEAGMRILKDKIFCRLRARNALHLIDYLTLDLEDYYFRVLSDASNDRLETRNKGVSVVKAAVNISKKDIVHTGMEIFTVRSQTTKRIEYVVDMSLGVCSCFVGTDGSPCKHQGAVKLHFQTSTINFRPTSVDGKAELYFLASGKRPRKEWWNPLFEDKRPNVRTQASSSDVTFDEIVEIVEEDPAQPGTSGTAMTVTRTDDAWNGFVAANQKMQETLSSMLKGDPEYVVPALEAYTRSFERMQGNNALISGLKTFGRHFGLHAKGTRIGLQPTAIARRKTNLAGKQITGRGRPTSTAFKNILSKYKAKNHAALPKKAPHSLSQCVSQNKSLGKTHSAK